ncbi:MULTISPECIES: ROK family transcriptional regulator [Arthrobacter]|uniref:ROK family transcriptional regulator n=2 Tax=Arthrobacter TaxID=1663 RepID=A0ABU9KKP4_9MICC|nr:ROK family transcriptional regulator [Arthrobacter sp. YJM1]MDP5227466.1 ROK family transcriptional regulator [Arthrobacter sp. YJM1]
MPSREENTKPTRTNPGSQSALRLLNRERVLQALSAGPATQAELSRATGLSTATISNIVKELEREGSVRTEPTTSSGRRALNVRLVADSSVAVGIDFGRRHVRVVLATRDYRVMAEAAASLSLGHHAELGISTARGLMERLLTENGLSHSDVIGAGVGIPGPLDRRSHTVAHGAVLPEWVGIETDTRLREALGIPVHVDNDANLGALAEATWGPHGGADNLVFVKIGSGIGAGLIVNGAPVYGNLGITGEIGHTAIDDRGAVCRCGSRGCLETVASTTTMIEQLSRNEPGPVSTQSIIAAARNGHPPTLRVLDDAGLAIGHALGTVANLLNPEVIVVGGPLAELGELLLAPIRRGILRHTIPMVGANTSLTVSSLGERAEALGAAALVFRRPAVTKR